MRRFSPIIAVLAIVTLSMAVLFGPLSRDGGTPSAQAGPTATPTPELGGTGYFFSLPGPCPGSPLVSIPAQCGQLQVNITWNDIPSNKARFHLVERSSRQSMPLLHSDLLFERVGAELYSCATASRGITYTVSGQSYFDHWLQTLDDVGDYIEVTPNPADLDTWSFDAMETVEPVSTATDAEQGSFEIDVSTIPMIYTRPDMDFGEPPVSQFSRLDTVYLLQPSPCPSDYVVFRVIGPNGFHWEEGSGQLCRSYAGRAYEVGYSLAQGDYEAEAFSWDTTGLPMYVWHFAVQ